MVTTNRLKLLLIFASLALVSSWGHFVPRVHGAESQPYSSYETYDQGLMDGRQPAAGWDACPPPVPWVNVTGQLLWMTRDMTEVGQPLIFESFGNIPVPFQTTLAQAGTDDLDFDVAAGFRGSVLIGPPGARLIELSYLGIYDLTSELFLTIPPPGAAPADPLEMRLDGSRFRFFNNDFISPTLFDWSVSYNSTIHSTELNFWLDDVWRFRPIVGLRWIQQAEQFDIAATVDPTVGGNSDVTNNLVGGQLGFLCILWRRTDWFRAQAICKAGCYHNDVDFNANMFSGGATLAAMQSTADSTSCSGEINVTALWQLGPHLNFHVGYTGLWLSEVVSIGDQFNDLNIATGTGQFDFRGASYQGGHLGCTVTW